jgi:hypothetical protein
LKGKKFWKVDGFVGLCFMWEERISLLVTIYVYMYVSIYFIVVLGYIVAFIKILTNYQIYLNSKEFIQIINALQLPPTRP